MEKVHRYIAVAFCALVTACFCTGCAGTPGGLAEPVTTDYRYLGRIESTVERIERTSDSVSKRLELIERAGSNIDNGLQRLEFLLTEYQRIVGEVLDENDRIKAELEQMAKSGSNSMDGATDMASTENTTTDKDNVR